jgi:hypothetical protein
VRRAQIPCAALKHDPLGSVEELQLETRVRCPPGLEEEVQLAAPLGLTGSVGDDDLDHVILDHVGDAAPAVEELPEVYAGGWIGESNAHGEESRLASSPFAILDSQPTAAQHDPSRTSCSYQR